MDFRDRPRSRPDDVACGVCRLPVVPERSRLLARRDDLLVLELHCAACASVTLGFIFAPDDRLLPECLRLAGAPPVSADDVLDMHLQLEAWQGDLRSLLEPSGRGESR